MKEYLLPAIIVFLILNLAAITFLLLNWIKKNKKKNEIFHYGDFAESKVSSYIKKNFPDSICMNSVYLKTEKGYTQIDHIVICKYGLFVIETKSHNGTIDNNDRNWVQRYNGKTVSFHNPFYQNEIHIKTLRKLLDEDKAFTDVNINGAVVFTSKNVTFTNKKNARDIVKLSQLASKMKRAQAYKNAKNDKKYAKLTDRPKMYLTKTMMIRLERHINSNSEKGRLRHVRHMSSMRKNARS